MEKADESKEAVKAQRGEEQTSSGLVSGQDTPGGQSPMPHLTDHHCGPAEPCRGQEQMLAPCKLLHPPGTTNHETGLPQAPPGSCSVLQPIAGWKEPK